MQWKAKVVKVLATQILIATKNLTEEEALKQINEKIQSGEVYNKFTELVKYQKGNIEKIELSKRIFSIKTDKEGFITSIDALKLGELVKAMGGGRKTKEDKIDFTVGVKLTVNVGDYVNKNDELMRIYLGNIDVSLEQLKGIFEIGSSKVEVDQIYEILK